MTRRVERFVRALMLLVFCPVYVVAYAIEGADKGWQEWKALRREHPPLVPPAGERAVSIADRWEVTWCNHPWVGWPDDNGWKARRFFTEREARAFRDDIRGKPETAWTLLRELRICKYGHNANGCELGHPGCLCADEAIIREMGDEPNRDLLTLFDQPQPWETTEPQQESADR